MGWQGTALVLAAGSLLAACGDARETVSGRFELVRTQVGELPALLGEMGGCRFQAESGHTELSDSTYSAELRRRRVCLPGAMGDSIRTADTTFVDIGKGTYTLQGDSVFFRFPHGASAGVGVLRGDTLVVEGPGQTLYYVRKQGG